MGQDRIYGDVLYSARDIMPILHRVHTSLLYGMPPIWSFGRKEDWAYRVSSVGGNEARVRRAYKCLLCMILSCESPC